MSNEETQPKAGKSYIIGSVGAGARIAQGENISWVEDLTRLPDGQALKATFQGLLDRIAANKEFDEDTRSLSRAKTEAVAEGLARANTSPGMLRQALADAKGWFASTATWVGDEIRDILKSEAAKKAIASVTEAATKAAIQRFIA